MSIKNLILSATIAVMACGPAFAEKLKVNLVRTDTRQIEVDVDLNGTVDDLKAGIAAVEGEFPAQGKLVVLGKELKTGLLTDYGITKDTVINLVLPLRG
jgi:hypothetical protein